MPRPFSSRGGSLTAEQAEDLLYMLEEEKLAGDLYEQLATQTGLSVFSRIAESEDRHFNALLRVAERSDLAVDAITGLPSGEYANTDLQNLYDDLLEQASIGTLEALQVGALVESTDIQDLQEAMLGLEDSALGRVYSHLLEGSERHLEAFTGQIAVWSDLAF
ncbi:MAG: hypothetical protein RLZZ216_1391 [Cyanobacteriota bacterium]